MSPLDTSKLFTVPDLVAVITGGGTGLGLMMSHALASAGASKVYIIGRRLDRLTAAAVPYPSIITPLLGDVTSKSSIQSCLDHITAETGYINLLICNSGITGPFVTSLGSTPTLSEFRNHVWNGSGEANSMAEFTETFNVNVTAVYFTAVAFLELLDAGNKKGNLEGVTSQIVVTGSIASYLRSVVPGFAYVASKAAAVHLMKSLSTYCARWDIRCNAIAPGFFPSEMTSSTLAHIGTIEKSFIPAGRVGSEEDMYGTILYLASRAGAYCNGVSIVLDGGRLCILPATY